MFNQLFKPILARFHRCKIEEVKHNIQKEKRIIDTLEPVLNRHRLVFDTDVVKNDVEFAQKENAAQYSLLYQLTRITKERGSLRHDDRLDALSMAVAYWSNNLSKDELLSKERYEEQLLDEQLLDFMDGVLLKDRGNNRKNDYRVFRTGHDC